MYLSYILNMLVMEYIYGKIVAQPRIYKRREDSNTFLRDFLVKPNLVYRFMRKFLFFFVEFTQPRKIVEI